MLKPNALTKVAFLSFYGKTALFLFVTLLVVLSKENSYNTVSSDEDLLEAYRVLFESIKEFMDNYQIYSELMVRASSTDAASLSNLYIPMNNELRDLIYTCRDPRGITELIAYQLWMAQEANNGTVDYSVIIESCNQFKDEFDSANKHLINNITYLEGLIKGDSSVSIHSIELKNDNFGSRIEKTVKTFKLPLLDPASFNSDTEITNTTPKDAPNTPAPNTPAPNTPAPNTPEDYPEDFGPEDHPLNREAPSRDYPGKYPGPNKNPYNNKVYLRLGVALDRKSVV